MVGLFLFDKPPLVVMFLIGIISNLEFLGAGRFLV